MRKYEEIHLWDFPSTLIHVRLKEGFRRNLFLKFMRKFSSQRKAAEFLNQVSSNYGLTRKYRHGRFYSWVEGIKHDGGKQKNCNIPLWVLIEISKFLSQSQEPDNSAMMSIEGNAEAYASLGQSNWVKKPKLPILITPEMVSVIFHFCGDGHLGGKRDCCSYKQKNPLGLSNVLRKLQNSFGEFDFSKEEFKNWRLNIPKVISDIYKYHFQLNNLKTFEARVPTEIKSLPPEFLQAGLCAFIVDEGHIWEVITVYSKNRALLEDIQEIARKCGYQCQEIREKFASGKLDCYRFSISSFSYADLYRDIKILEKKFPTCTLVHKMEKLEQFLMLKNLKIERASSVHQSPLAVCCSSK